MLEHQKLVLQNVAYNKDLFKKELIKSLSWLSVEEQEKLVEWLLKNFANHGSMIRDVIEIQEMAMDC